MIEKTIFNNVSEQSSDLVSLLTKGTTTSKSKGKESVNQWIASMQFIVVVIAYKLMATLLKGGAYENKPRKQTALNMFVKYNMGKIKLYFTKEEMAGKASVVAPYHVSDGSLPTIALMVQDNILVSDVKVPNGFTMTNNTTIGEVSEALLKCNSHLRSGDQFSIVHLVQGTTPEGIPQMATRLHEFVIDKTSLVPFYSHIPQSMFFITGNHIGTDANAEAGGMAYVLSRSIYSNKLLVSSQNIVLTPGYTLYKTYSSDAQKRKAMESYANIEDRYLDPSNKTGEDLQDSEDEYFAVTGVTLNNVPVAQGSGAIEISPGYTIVITGIRLSNIGLKARVKLNPIGNPVTVNLSNIGNLVVTDATITLSITTGTNIFYFLRADNEVIVYDFGE
jgi:hypothetical protein